MAWAWWLTGSWLTGTGTSWVAPNAWSAAIRTCLSIAAASILAKVTRDRMMRAEAEHFPYYNFEANKGYPCPIHKAALQAWGPSSIHRKSWVFMDHLIWNGSPRPHSRRAAGALLAS